MKTRLLFPMVLAILTLTQAFAQSSAQPPLITVSGSAEVKVAPNEVYLRVGVETRHQNLADAKQQNDQRVEQRTGRWRLDKSASRHR